MNFNFTHTDYNPHFSGHESFHLRYGWLKKAHDEVAKTQKEVAIKVFTDDDAIARFGVGKNMIASIRYWATSCGILQGKNITIELAPLGDKLFGQKGMDPYLENANSLWLIHWHLASNMEKTSYYWMFNYFSEPSFNRKVLSSKLFQFSEKCGWEKPTKTTVEKDLAVLLNTYSMVPSQKKGSEEDSLTSPLAELGLIRKSQNDDELHLGWGAKPNLGDGTFLFALLDFWDRQSSANTLSFQSILLDHGSPGRIFLMDESDLAVRLMNLENLTDGKLCWSETAGMRQIVRNKKIEEHEKWAFVSKDFVRNRKRAA